MSKMTRSLGGNTGAILAGGMMVAALALGAYLSFGTGEVIQGETGAVTEQTSSASTVKTPQSAPDQAVETVAPSFDELRRETDGTTIIAGRAEPLSEVEILVDGKQVGTAMADGTGGFAAIASLPVKDVAQVVSLTARSGSDVTTSVDEIILAPTTAAPQIPEAPLQASIPAAPAVVADAEDDVAQERAAEANAPVDTAPPRVAVLKSDIAGVSLLSVPVTDEVALDTIGYSEDGEVQLTGRAQPETAKVRVYLDNRSVISLPVGVDGRWRGDLPDVDEGIYTLRVDEVSASGAVSSRVETPFRRESAEALSKASASAGGPIRSITVQAGATLWAIARERYGNGTLYVRVFEANADAIRDPDLIYPGQVFDLPN